MVIAAASSCAVLAQDAAIAQGEAVAERDEGVRVLDTQPPALPGVEPSAYRDIAATPRQSRGLSIDGGCASAYAVAANPGQSLGLKAAPISGYPLLDGAKPVAPTRPVVLQAAVDGEASLSASLVSQKSATLAGEPLSLKKAEELAETFHPTLREAAARVRAARGNWLQVGLRPNPEIGYAGNEMGNDGRAGQQGGFLSQEFVTAGKLDLNRAVAMREQAAAEARLEIARWQVLTTARKSYFELLAAQRTLALAHQLSEIAERSVSVSRQRLQAKDIAKTALLQSQIENDSALLLEQQATARYEAARRRLASVLGVEEHEVDQLEDTFAQPLPELEFEPVFDRLAQDSPELSELRFDVDRARWNVQRQAAGRVPNVNLQSGVQYDNATEDTIANVQLSVPLPVYNRNQGAIAQACGELAAARAALESRELSLRQRLSTAFRDYLSARQRVAKYTQTILPAAKETLDLTNMGYQQGELEYLQLYNVQQIYAAKNLAYLKDLETSWKSWAEIDGFLVGELPASAESAISPNAAE
ncbi:MAG: TolC family protein [Pirellulales bacterium]|nr:TolC family protein [Pirellulales bacterium]